MRRCSLRARQPVGASMIAVEVWDVEGGGSQPPLSPGHDRLVTMATHFFLDPASEIAYPYQPFAALPRRRITNTIVGERPVMTRIYDPSRDAALRTTQATWPYVMPLNRMVLRPDGGSETHNIVGRLRNGGVDWHGGGDYATLVGTPAVAITDAEVVFAGMTQPQSNGYGVTVILKFQHKGQTLYAWYAHLLFASVKATEPGKVRKVRRGQVVGLTGRTGNAIGTRPHLHFEIRSGADAQHPYGSTPIDPAEILGPAAALCAGARDVLPEAGSCPGPAGTPAPSDSSAPKPSPPTTPNPSPPATPNPSPTGTPGPTAIA
jgi:hypothetical protein